MPLFEGRPPVRVSGILHHHLAWLCDFGRGEDPGNDEIGFVVPFEKEVRFPEIYGTETVAYSIGDNLIICFRGTELTDAHDMLRNLRILPWYNKHTGWSHSGFQKGATTWCGFFIPFLRHVFPEQKNIILVGHSQGSQVAAHCALLIASKWHNQDSFGNQYRLKEVCLFGEPKGFFRSAKKRYEKLGLSEVTTSYKNGSDNVTKVPPWGKHTVKQTEIGDNDFIDHPLVNYIKTLEEVGL